MMTPITGMPRGGGRGNGLGERSLLRELLLRLPAAVAYLAGPELVFEFANQEYRRLVGGREVMGLPLREALPELAPQRVEALYRAARGGPPFEGREAEVWVRRHGQQPEQIFLDFLYQAVRDDTGQVAGVLLYASDVTGHVRDRRRLEELTRRLATTEERYRTLFETLPQGVIHYRADGSVLGANPASREILGLSPEKLTPEEVERARRVVHEDGSPYRADEVPVMVALRTGQIVADAVVGATHGGTGELRWLRVTAVPDARDGQGRPQRVYAMLADITEQRRTEAALREGNRLLGRLREANVLGVVVAGEHGLQEANDAFLDIIGYTRGDLAAGRIDWRAITPAEWAASDDAALEQLRRTGVCQPYEKEHLHRDGHRVPILVGAAVIDWQPLRWATFVVDLTARQRREQERAALVAREQRARVEADSARERLAFLLRAGDLVAATRSREELLARVTQLVVPVLADFCVAFMPTAEGMLRAALPAHRDPAGAEVLLRLREHPVPAEGPVLIQAAYSTATTQRAGGFSAAAPGWAGADPEVMNILAQVRPAAAVAVPLLAGQHPLGVLVLGRAEPRGQFAESDVAVAEELARRLAAGLANVETFAREHTVAETLQRSLLPDLVPGLAGLDLAVRYLPASDGVHVGGDWYDAFPLEGGRVGLVIGDAAGHSIESATIMGQVRSLLRGYAIHAACPAEVMRQTNAAICQLLPEAVVTVCYAVLDPATGGLSYANAGHPPPIVSTGHGQAEYLSGAAGVMLGVSAGAGFTPGHHRLAAGTRLLLYTDGLVEDRWHDISEGMRELVRTVRRSPAGTAEQLCQAVRRDLVGAAPREDDVCILAVLLPG